MPDQTSVAGDSADVRHYRLARVRAALVKAGLDCAVLFDPINIRYATGTRNMQVWSMHNICRYAFVAVDGPVVLFDYAGSAHLARGIETVGTIRPARSWDYFAAGSRNVEQARKWAAEIADLVSAHGTRRRIGVDRLDLLPLRALEALGLDVEDAKPALERARSIKSDQEVRQMEFAYAGCADAIRTMRESLRPGMRESDALATLSAANITFGGEYLETRLLTSGPRTNPWLQETSNRVMLDGEMMVFDTDLVGAHGIFTDVSRAWVIGDTKPDAEQRMLYSLAHEQLQHNIGLLAPGVGFREFADNAWPIPSRYEANRYAEHVHGVGLAVEYPLVYHKQDAAEWQYDGEFEPGMTVCVESYIGAENGCQGVKLEQPVFISENGVRVLCDYHFEQDMIG
ncbi:M24 family metallopeptidase [Novosphingobium sp.]|uniref:M24 family metallopeptidase n=1 Tax=Novosphingobium sp. TaxID=1874826 RepID=UPI003B51F38A